MFNLFSPGKSRINKDIEKLRNLLEEAKPDLIPWNSDEWEHLSYQEGELKNIKTRKRWQTGVFHTIFYEKIIAYAYKKYFWASDKLMCVQTSRDEYLYHFTGKDVRVAMNNYAVGRITDDDTLMDPRKKKQLGFITYENRMGYIIVNIKGKDLGHLRHADNPNNYNNKVFEFIKSMDEEEEKYFFSLVLFEMIRKHVQ